MPRIKLNRPPPVSSDTAKDTVCDNNNPKNVLSDSQTTVVRTADITTDVEKCPSDVRLVNRKVDFLPEEDTRRVVKHKHSAVRDAHKELCPAAPENTLRGLYSVSDSSVKKPKKEQRHRNVIQKDTAQTSLSGNDATEPQDVARSIADSIDSSAVGCHDTASVIHQDSVSSKQSYVCENRFDISEFISTGSDVLSKGGSDSSFYDNSYLANSAQEAVARTEHQESGVEVNKKQPGLLLDEVLKGFLVNKLAVIENERKGTDTDCQDAGLKPVVQPTKHPELTKLRRNKRSRESHELQKDSDCLQANLRHEGSYQTFPRHDRDYTMAHVDCQDASVESVVQSEPTKRPELTRWRRNKRSAESHERQRESDCLPAKLRHEDSSLPLPHRDSDYTMAHFDARYRQTHIGKRQHSFMHHRHYYMPRCFTDVRKTTKQNFDGDVRSSRIGRRIGRRKQEHSTTHSLHAKRDLFHSERQNQQTEHRRQSLDFTPLEQSPLNEQRSFDCVEEIRHFVSRNVPKFLESASENYVPLENYHDESRALNTDVRERRKSGSTADRHYHHHHHQHHHKKRNRAMNKMCRHKRVEHQRGRKNLKTSKNVKGVLTSKKRLKHKHKHHKKITLPSVSVDSKKQDKSEAPPDMEPENGDDALTERRSLSPLVLHRSHHKKHKKKKSSEKAVSQISVQNVPSLQESGDTLYNKISSDEEFIPMKVKRREDDGDDTMTKALPQMDVPNTDGVNQIQTNSKSAVELQSKLLKISGKRRKSQTHMPDANPVAESPLFSEFVQNSITSVEDRSFRDLAEDKLPVLEDAAVTSNTAEETQAPLIGEGREFADPTVISDKAAAVAITAVSEQASSCSSLDDRNDLQTSMISVDHSANEVNSKRNITLVDEASVISEKAADGSNLTESFETEKTLQLRETVHQGTVNETDSLAKEIPAQDNIDSTRKIFPSDAVSKAVSGEELKLNREEHDSDEACKAASSQLNILPDIECKEVQENTTAERQNKDSETFTTEEIKDINEETQSVSDDSAADAAENCPVHLNETASTEASPALDVAARGDNNVTKTVRSTEDTSASVTDVSVGKSHSASRSTLMGPPMLLPPSKLFKKPLPVMKMRLRITDTSADFISSAKRNNKEGEKEESDENREEGYRFVSVIDCMLLLICI